MSDKKLQREFDEYFEGTNLPEDITADAKARLRQKKRGGFFKWLVPVALAVVLVSVGFIAAYMDFSANFQTGNGGNSANSPQYTYYSSSSLSESPIDPYSAGEIKGLTFAEKLAKSGNASVRLTGFEDENGLKYALASASMIHGGYRYDAVIYAEYTEEYLCLEELKDYLSGSERILCGRVCIFSASYDNGENVYKIYFRSGGVKYYLSVITSDGEKNLSSILENF